jgi:hypothetical protein
MDYDTFTLIGFAGRDPWWIIEGNLYFDLAALRNRPIGGLLRQVSKG